MPSVSKIDVRVSNEVYERLKAIAKRRLLSISDVVRQAVLSELAAADREDQARTERVA